jgi:hypothetical protein
MQTRQAVPAIPNAPDGLPVGYLDALDEVSEEFAAIFESEVIDRVRFYAAVSRLAELGYAVTGNGYYLYLKGMIRIGPLPNVPPPPS